MSDPAAARPALAKHQIGVLVVEDEALLLVELADTLSKAGLIVFEAMNADEALNLLASRNDIRVLITDISMPDSTLNGYQLASLVGARWPQIGLLLVSGVEQPERGDLPLGVRFVPKPYRSRDLVSAVFAHVAEQTGSI